MLTTGIADQRALYATLGDVNRLAYLDSVRSKISAYEVRWRDFARRACELTGSELGVVTLVEKDHVLILATWGGTSLPEEKAVSDAICAHAVALSRPLAIDDARRDRLFRNHTLVRALGVVGYLGVPIPASSSHAWGALCAVDWHPRNWTTLEHQGLVSLSAQMHEVLAHAQ